MMMRIALLSLLLLTVPAAAQQQQTTMADRVISVLIEQRNAAANAHAQAEAQVRMLTEENMKLRQDLLKAEKK